MKKRLISCLLLSALCLFLALPVLADSARELPLICDAYGLLTEEQAEELNERAESYSRQYSCDIIVVVVSDTDYYDVETFTEGVYNKYNYGWGADRSAVLQTKADNYLSGDLQLLQSEDRFLRKDVTRVRRSEGSGGGRGGTSVRSSGFSHHSGKF